MDIIVCIKCQKINTEEGRLKRKRDLKKMLKKTLRDRWADLQFRSGSFFAVMNYEVESDV